MGFGAALLRFISQFHSLLAMWPGASDSHFLHNKMVTIITQGACDDCQITQNA